MQYDANAGVSKADGPSYPLYAPPASREVPAQMLKDPGEMPEQGFRAAPGFCILPQHAGVSMHMFMR